MAPFVISVFLGTCCSFKDLAISSETYNSVVKTSVPLFSESNTSSKKTAPDCENFKKFIPNHSLTNTEKEIARKYISNLAKEINSATQNENDERALELGFQIFDYFEEYDLLRFVKYAGIDDEGNIVYVREYPTSFPTKIERNSQGEIISYSIDWEETKKNISCNGICDYLLIFSPLDGMPLFRIKICDELLFYWTGE